MFARAEPRLSTALLRRLKLSFRIAGGWGVLRAVAGLLLFLALWWTLSLVPVLAAKTPSPAVVLDAWLKLLSEGIIIQGVWNTGRSFMLAWLVAGGIGLSVGIAIAVSETVRQLLTPVVEALRPIPSAAIIPLAIVLIGLNDQMKISVAAYAATWPVLMTAAGALGRIDEQLVHICRQFGLRGQLRYLWRVQIPSVSPELLTSLRTASVIALALTITTELVSSGDGIGNWIVRYEQAARTPEMFACIVTVMIIGSLIYGAVIVADRALTPWVSVKV